MEITTYILDPTNADTDGDGLNDLQEISLSTDPRDQDTDDDNVSDGDEVVLGINPKDKDSDNDGLEDGDEVLTYKTDPTKIDTDLDTLSDGDEILRYKTNPLSVDTDGDTISDYAEVLTHSTNPNSSDTDGDTISDNDEIAFGYSPIRSDTDNDGLADNVEDANKNGIKESYETSVVIADTDNDGAKDGVEVSLGTDPISSDTDNDGVQDGDEISIGLDPFTGDSNNDGINDVVEFNNTTKIIRSSLDSGGGSQQTLNYDLKYQSFAPLFASFETENNHQLISGIHFDADIETVSGYEVPFESKDVTLNTRVRGMIATKLEILIQDKDTNANYFNTVLDTNNATQINEIWQSTDTLNNQEKPVEIKARAFDGLTWSEWFVVPDNIIVDNLAPRIESFLLSETIFSPNNESSIGVKDSIDISVAMLEDYLDDWNITIRNSNDEITNVFTKQVTEELVAERTWFGKNDNSNYVMDGNYKVSVLVKDKINNITEAELDVIVDNTAPDINVSLAAQGQALNSGKIDLISNWSGTDNFDQNIDYKISYSRLTPAVKEIDSLELWLDASDSNSLDKQGGRLERWQDKSSNGNHFAQASFDNRPLLKENSILDYDTILFDVNSGLESRYEMSAGLKYMYAVVKDTNDNWIVVSDMINIVTAEKIQLKNGSFNIDLLGDQYTEVAEILVFSMEQSAMLTYLNTKWQNSNLPNFMPLVMNGDGSQIITNQDDNALYQIAIEGMDNAGNKQVVYSDTILAPDRTAPFIANSLTSILGIEDESFSINLDDQKFDNKDSDANLRWVPSIIYTADNPALSSEEILNNVTATNAGQDLQFDLVSNANTEPALNGNIFGKENAYITLRLEDAEGNFSEKNIQLIINAINDPPEFIAEIGDPVKDSYGDIIYNIKFDEDTVGPILTLDNYIQDVDNVISNLEFILDSDNFYEDLSETNGIGYKSEYFNVIIGDETTQHQIQFLPVANWYGDQPLTLKVTDSDNLSVTKNIIVRVWPVNDPPIIKDGIEESYSYNEDTSFSLTFKEFEDDVEFEDRPPTHNGLLNWDIVSYDSSIISNVEIVGDTLTFTPVDNQYGTANVIIQLTDTDTVAESVFPEGSVYGGYSPSPLSVTKSIDLVWTPVNDPPVLTEIPNQIKAEDNSAWILDLSSFKSDIEDGDTPRLLKFNVTMSDDYLSYTYDESTNQLVFTPKENAFGTTKVTVTLTDSDTNINFNPYVPAPLSVSQTFDVVLESVNDVPVISSIVLKSNLTNLQTVALTTDELRVEAFGFSDVGFSNSDQTGSEYDTKRASEPFFTPNTEKYKFEWLVDGESVTQNTDAPQNLNFSTLAIDESMEGKMVSVKVWPHDGVDFGNPIETTMPVNTRPTMVAENDNLLPVYNYYFPTVNVSLNWDASTDIDADLIKYRLKVWKVPKWHSSPSDVSLESTGAYFDSGWQDGYLGIEKNINNMKGLLAEEELHGTYYWKVWTANEFESTYFDFIDTSWLNQFNIDLIAPGVLNNGGAIDDDFLNITSNVSLGLAENIRILYGTKPASFDDNEQYQVILEEINQPDTFPDDPITITENIIVDSVEFDNDADPSLVYWTYIITFPPGITTYNIILKDSAGNESLANTFVITPDFTPPTGLMISEDNPMLDIEAITSQNSYAISGFKEPSSAIWYEGLENGVATQSIIVGYTPVSEFTFNIYPDKPSGNLIVRDRAGNENTEDIVNLKIDFLRGEPTISTEGFSRDVVNAKENETALSEFGLLASQITAVTTAQLNFSVNRDIIKYQLIVSNNVVFESTETLAANTLSTIQVEGNRSDFTEGQNRVVLRVIDAANNIGEKEFQLTLQSEEPNFNVFQNGSFLAKIDENNWNLSLTGVQQDNVQVFVNDSQENIITENTYWAYISADPFNPAENDIYVTLIDNVYNYVKKPIWESRYYSQYASSIDIPLPIQELYNAEIIALTYNTLPDGIASLTIIENSNTNSLRMLIDGLYSQPVSLLNYEFEDNQLSIPTELTNYSLAVVAKDAYGNTINHVDLSGHGVSIKINYPESNLFDEDELVVIEYDDLNMLWKQNEKNTMVERLSKSVVSEINNTGVYALAQLEEFQNSLSSLRVYPNPWIPSDGNADTGNELGEQSGITFDKLTLGTEISIYTITGELVRHAKVDAAPSKWSWDGKNDLGNNVFSGVYLYVVKSKNETKTGKITIVR